MNRINSYLLKGNLLSVARGTLVIEREQPFQELIFSES